MLTIEVRLRAVVDAHANGQPEDMEDAIAAAVQELKELDRDRKDHELTIEAARSNYADPSDNDIEIDDEPLLSVADGGVWVSAWVWVPTEADEEDDR